MALPPSHSCRRRYYSRPASPCGRAGSALAAGGARALVRCLFSFHLYRVVCLVTKKHTPCSAKLLLFATKFKSAPAKRICAKKEGN